MKQASILFAISLLLVLSSCSKKSATDAGDDCNGNASVRFINSTGQTLKADVSQAGETNNSFTNPVASISVPSGTTLDQLIPAGSHIVRWSNCSSACTVYSLNNSTYEACGDYDEQAAAAASDARYKQDIQSLDADAVTAGVMKLNPSAYYYNFNKYPGLVAVKGKTFGFLAQELEQTFPETVVTDKDGFRSVNYTALIPVLTSVIQHQQQQIDELKKIVDKIENN